ncbi:uncharacterized protein LOC120353296 [Nilaparvata lugens]|uniref:uncharacterized protein LOC120353296 n=1 Tax=Nilaparvata lugens TaxID=108931 RepID=UPI00193D4D84|nr:uncharacterized protein LOC120353296 [Nilaparvata lugens]
MSLMLCELNSLESQEITSFYDFQELLYSQEHLLKMYRCVTCLFGICNYGVGTNGYVNDPEKGLCIWLQKRSKTKQTWPERWDNMHKMTTFYRNKSSKILKVRTDFRSAPQPNVTPAERLMIDRGATVVRPGNARRSNIFRNVHDGCVGGATVVRWRNEGGTRAGRARCGLEARICVRSSIDCSIIN